MKRKDITNLHSKSNAELNKEVGEKRKMLGRLMSEKQVKPGKNSREFRMLKVDIARILTVMHEIKKKESKTK